VCYKERGRVARSKKIKRTNPVISNFKKVILKNEKRSDFLQKFVKITIFKV